MGKRRLQVLIPQITAATDTPGTQRRRARREANLEDVASDFLNQEGEQMMTPLQEVNVGAFPRPALHRGLAAPSSFSGMTFRTNDLEGLSEFWGTMFDMEPSHKSERLHVYQVPADEPFQITIMGFSKEECPDRHPNDVAPDHFAINYASFRELMEMYKRMAAKKYKVAMPVHHGYGYSIYWLAPDGTQVETQCEGYPDSHRPRAWWHTEDMYVKGGFGAVNPEKDSEDFFAGRKTGSELLTRKGVTEKEKAAFNKPGPTKMTQLREKLVMDGPTQPKNEACDFLQVPTGPAQITRVKDLYGKPIYFQHLVIRSEQTEPMIAYYKNLLSADQHAEIGGFITFGTFDEENHRIAIITASPGRGEENAVKARVKNSVGVHASQWSYDSLQDLVKAGKQNRLRGQRPFKVLQDPAGGISMFYRDMDQNITELRYATREQNEALFEKCDVYPSGEEMSFEDLEKIAA